MILGGRGAPLIVVASIAACGGGAAPVQGPVEPQATAGLAAGSYVLVWQDAWLEGRGSRARFDDDPGRPTGAVVAWRVIADEGELILVENVATSSDDHCHRGPAALDAMRLQVRVRRADLAPVVTRDAEITFDDGTAVAVRAGTQVTKREALHQVVVDGVGLRLPLASADVAESYRPTPRLDRSVDPDPVTATYADAALRYGPHVIDEHPELAIHASEPAGDGTVRVALHTRCLALRVRTGPDDIAEAGGLAVDVDGDEHYHDVIQPGSAITWPDGTPAGETVGEGKLATYPLETTLAGKSCRGVLIRDFIPMNDEPAYLEVCFDTDKIEERN